MKPYSNAAKPLVSRQAGSGDPFAAVHPDVAGARPKAKLSEDDLQVPLPHSEMPSRRYHGRPGTMVLRRK
jgi:hypothetical protein